MHKISISADLPYHRDADLDAVFSMYRRAGLDGIDFSLCYFDEKHGYPQAFWTQEPAVIHSEIRRFKDALDRNGICVEQTHAPYPTLKLESGAEVYNEYTEIALHRSIECTALLGGKYVVIHPVHKPNTVLFEEELAANLAFYPKFIQDAKRFGITICLENMWGRRNGSGSCIFDSACADPHEACALIDRLNELAGEKVFAFCFDVGHANLCGKHMQNTIRLLGDRIVTLHIHDTDKTEDLHTLPYSQCVPGGPITDWQGMLWGLRDIGYRGFLNFEVDSAFQFFPAPTHEALCGLFAAIGRYFSTEITGVNKQ